MAEHEPRERYALSSHERYVLEMLMGYYNLETNRMVIDTLMVLAQKGYVTPAPVHEITWLGRAVLENARQQQRPSFETTWWRVMLTLIIIAVILAAVYFVSK